MVIAKGFYDKANISVSELDSHDDNNNIKLWSSNSLTIEAILYSILFLLCASTKNLTHTRTLFKQFLLAIFYQSSYFQNSSLTS